LAQRVRAGKADRFQNDEEDLSGVAVVKQSVGIGCLHFLQTETRIEKVFFTVCELHK